MEFASHDDIYVYVHMYIHMSSTGQYSIYCKHHLFMQIYICQKWDHITNKDFQPVPTPAPSVSVNIPLDYREWLRVFPCKESQDFSPGPLSDFFPTGNLNLTLETQSTHAHAYTHMEASLKSGIWIPMWLASHLLGILCLSFHKRG